jgi:hypothetical protein
VVQILPPQPTPSFSFAELDLTLVAAPFDLHDLYLHSVESGERKRRRWRQ